MVQSNNDFKQTDIFRVTPNRLRELFDATQIPQSRLQLLQDLGGVQGVLKAVQSEASTGVMGNEGDLERRVAFYGANVKPSPQKPPFTESLVDALNDRVLLLVAAFAILSIITGTIYEPATGWIEGVCIIGALVFQVAITSLNDWFKDRQFVSLLHKTREESLPVVRGKAGSMQTVSAWDMVIGDVVSIKAGDRIPADCLIIESANLTLDESDQREDTRPVRKSAESDPFLLADSFVLTGSARVVVAAVGEKSSRGINAQSIDTREQTTRLSRKLDRIGGSLKFLALICSGVILVTSLVILTIQTMANDQVDAKVFMKKLMDNITLALILLIVAIPEGLSMTVAISLAHSVNEMYDQDSLLVRDLTAPEELGLVNEVVLGKTGTMTTEEMSVECFYTQNLFIKNSRKNTLLNCSLTEEIIQKLQESIVFNSTAYIEMDENSFYQAQGQGTEVSLIKWLQTAEIPVHKIMNSREGRIRAQIPFDNKLKRSIVAVELPDLEDTVRIYVKGAPENVVENCISHYNEFGQKVPFDRSAQDYTLNDIMKTKMCENGLRVIAFSYTDLTLDQFAQLKEQTDGFTDESSVQALEQNQTFLGVIALQDTLRDRIKDTLEYAPISGIGLTLVSGDNLDTVKSIARQAGILSPEQADPSLPIEDQKLFAMHAKEFREAVGPIRQTTDEEGNINYSVTDQQAFDQIMDTLKVLARAVPEDKQLVVAGLRGQGKKVAVVGEGVSDIASFDAANASFAMGSGTSLARNRASMILTNDNFESLMRGIMWGRNVYQNIQRFLQFQITVNLSCLLTVFIGYIFMTESPINAVQLIWINLIMDIFGALALASMKPSTDIAKTKVDQERIMAPHIYRQIFGVALYQLAVMMIVMLGANMVFGISYDKAIQTTDNSQMGKDKKEHVTLIWNTFVWLQLFNMICCREVLPNRLNPFGRFLSNWIFLVIFVALATFQYFACTSWIGAFFENAYNEVSPENFAKCIFFAAPTLLVSIFYKFLPLGLIEAFMPQLDETKAMGSDNAFMRAYETQAHGAAIPMHMIRGGQASEALNRSDEQGLATNDADNEFQRLDA